jgi:hypothetical protein
MHDPAWRGRADARAKKLPRKLRPIASALLAPPPMASAYEERRAHDATVLRAGTALDALHDGDRLAICLALHPKLGPVISRWWSDACSQPYTIGYMRRAFRAPRSPAITAPVRSRQLALLVSRLGPYDHDASWLAAWAPHIGAGDGYGYDEFTHSVAGPLLAAAVDLGGPAGDYALATLLAVGNGEHPVGMMGRHVIVGLLRCGREEGWAFVERLLLAAQRQEGLRQSILEAIDEGHPAAFDRMLDVILEHDLLRFAAAVRAAGVWLGLRGDVTEIPQVTQRVRRLRDLRLDPSATARAVRDGDAWEAYTALCAIAMRDVEAATPACEVALRRAEPDSRAAGLRFLAAASLTSTVRRNVDFLDDPDTGVAMLAFSQLGYVGEEDLPADLFDRLERLAERLPATPKTVQGLGIESAPLTVAQGPVVSRMIWSLRNRPVSRMLRWIEVLDPHGRAAGRPTDAGAAGHARPSCRRPQRAGAPGGGDGDGPTAARRPRGPAARAAPHPQGRRSPPGRARAPRPPAPRRRCPLGRAAVGRRHGSARRRLRAPPPRKGRIACRRRPRRPVVGAGGHRVAARAPRRRDRRRRGSGS